MFIPVDNVLTTLYSIEINAHFRQILYPIYNDNNMSIPPSYTNTDTLVRHLDFNAHYKSATMNPMFYTK